MRWHTVDYREGDGASSAGGRVSRGFWLHGIPRPLLWCRLFGHRPVVDGRGPNGPGLSAYRWVVCDRCAVRPDPQGHLDPEVWNVGDRYTGPWRAPLPANPRLRRGAFEAMKLAEHYPPGPWEARPKWTFGGQIVLFRRHDPKIGFTVKVGNTGSENSLALDIHLPWLGSLYLHTGRLGAGLVRRLNGVGYESKVISVHAHNGHLYWRFWVNRDGGWKSHATRRERLRDGSVQIDPRTILLGPKRYDYTNVGDPVAERVRMAADERYDVRLQLRHVSYGRKRGRKSLSWSVDWTANPGIPTKPGDRGRISGSSVKVSDLWVAADIWPIVARGRIEFRIDEDRRRNEWRPKQVAV